MESRAWEGESHSESDRLHRSTSSGRAGNSVRRSEGMRRFDRHCIGRRGCVGLPISHVQATRLHCRKGPESISARPRPLSYTAAELCGREHVRGVSNSADEWKRQLKQRQTARVGWLRMHCIEGCRIQLLGCPLRGSTWCAAASATLGRLWRSERAGAAVWARQHAALHDSFK